MGKDKIMTEKAQTKQTVSEKAGAERTLALWLRLCVLAGMMGGSYQALAQPAQSAQPDLHIRVLAASCAACHGTNGVSVSTTPSLAGMPAQDFLTRMTQFRDSKKTGDVMTQHAKGLTADEIRKLASYFASLPPPG